MHEIQSTALLQLISELVVYALIYMAITQAPQISSKNYLAYTSLSLWLRTQNRLLPPPMCASFPGPQHLLLLVRFGSVPSPHPFHAAGEETLGGGLGTIRLSQTQL